MTIGDIIAVGIHQGRWMYVTEFTKAIVYGRVWKPTTQKWTVQAVWYSIDAIDQKQPKCPRPLPPND